MMDIINPTHSWKKRLIDLLEKSNITLEDMGFPNDWQSRVIWQPAINS